MAEKLKGYPLSFLALSSISGIFIIGPFHIFLKFLWTFLFLLGLFVWHDFVIIVLGILFLTISGFRYKALWSIPSSKGFMGKRVHVEGRIRFFPKRYADNSLSFILDSRVGGMSVRCKCDDFKLWGGEKVSIYLKPKVPKNLNNPGAFDYVSYMRRKGIIYTAWLESSANVKVLSRESSILVFLRKRLWRLGSGIKGRDERGVFLSLLLGEKGMIPSDLMEKIRNAGLSHIFAISGLHLILVFLVFQRIIFEVLSFKRSWLDLGIAFLASYILSLIPTCFYALITGFSVPTKRALFGLFIYILLFILKRERDLLIPVLGAMAFQLLIWPQELFTASFILSFSATFSILFSIYLLKKLDISSSILRYTIITISPFYFTLPLQALFFHYIPLYAPISNLIAIPLVGGFILPGIIIVGLLYLLFPHHVFSWLGFVLTKPVIFLSEISQFPLSRIPVLRKDILILLAFLIIPLSFYYSRKILYLSFILFLSWLISNFLPSHPRIFILDVGEGSCVLIKDKKKTLIDFGPFSGKKLLSSINGLGVRRIDIAILTSPYPGCSRGISILRDLRPRIFYYRKLPLRRGFIEELSKVHMRILQIKSRKSISLGDLSLLLIPTENGLAVAVKDIMLITGGIRMRELEGIEISKVPIMQVPRSGSISAFCSKVLDLVSPRVVVTSAGRKDHPHRKILNELKKRGIKMMSTVDYGCIDVNPGDEIEIRGLKPPIPFQPSL